MSLPAGGTASQSISLAALGAPSTVHDATVRFTAQTAPSTSATVRATVGSATGSITVSGGWRTYEIQLPLSSVMSGASTGLLTLSANAQVSLTNVQAFTFTQLGDVYSLEGLPGIAVPALEALNRQLAAPSSR